MWGRKKNCGNTLFSELLAKNIVKIETVNFVEAIKHYYYVTYFLVFTYESSFRKVEAKVKDPVSFRFEESCRRRPVRIVAWRFKPLEDAYVVSAGVVKKCILRSIVITAAALLEKA